MMIYRHFYIKYEIITYKNSIDINSRFANVIL